MIFFMIVFFFYFYFFFFIIDVIVSVRTTVGWSFVTSLIGVTLPSGWFTIIIVIIVVVIPITTTSIIRQLCHIVTLFTTDQCVTIYGNTNGIDHHKRRSFGVDIEIAWHNGGAVVRVFNFVRLRDGAEATIPRFLIRRFGRLDEGQTGGCIFSNLQRNCTILSKEKR